MKGAIDWKFTFSTTFICWNLSPNVMIFGGGAFWRWICHDGGAPMNGISALIEETPESSLVPSTMWVHSEKTAIYEPGTLLSPDNKSVNDLVLDSLACYRTGRNKRLLFKPPSLWYFCYCSPNKLRQKGEKKNSLFSSKVASLHMPLTHSTWHTQDYNNNAATWD